MSAIEEAANGLVSATVADGGTAVDVPSTTTMTPTATTTPVLVEEQSSSPSEYATLGISVDTSDNTTNSKHVEDTDSLTPSNNNGVAQTSTTSSVQSPWAKYGSSSNAYTTPASYGPWQRTPSTTGAFGSTTLTDHPFTLMHHDKQYDNDDYYDEYANYYNDERGDHTDHREPERGNRDYAYSRPRSRSRSPSRYSEQHQSSYNSDNVPIYELTDGVTREVGQFLRQQASKVKLE
ncbi:hypothetical protein GQ42DRAFT_176371 [Ramicandelaber brevisporus]|nr:hypothetical protein GQ42DRAFT_176371 [Ramicandelaber brevisporus]